MIYLIRFLSIPIIVIGVTVKCFAISRQPNVVIVMTDDQGFGDVHSHGNKFIDTPVHDRIANEGECL